MTRRIRQGAYVGRPAFLLLFGEYAFVQAVNLHRAGSRAAFSEVLLDLRTSRVRRQSACPGNFSSMMCGPAGSFSIAGAFPKNLSSTKISAPSGSEETETVPTASPGRKFSTLRKIQHCQPGPIVLRLEQCCGSPTPRWDKTDGELREDPSR